MCDKDFLKSVLNRIENLGIKTLHVMMPNHNGRGYIYIYITTFEFCLTSPNWMDTGTQVSIGSLSTRVFETRTATGSELISLLTYPHTTTFTLLSIFSLLKVSSRKSWGTLRSKHAKCSLPVAVRVLKTRVLFFCDAIAIDITSRQQ